jgi:mono/diheme cytochrome c family protein
MIRTKGDHMKRILMIAVAFTRAVFGVVQVGSARVAGQDPEVAATTLPDKIFKRGLAMAPVALNLDGKDRKLVGEGSYIVNTACVGCHTNPEFAAGGNPFFGQPERMNTQNYLAGGAVFGPFK